MSSPSRLVQNAADQKMLAGAQQFLPKLPTLTVGAQSFAPADVAAILQGLVASSQAVQTAAAAWAAAVRADRTQRAQAAPLVKAFKRVVQGMFPDSVDTLAVFGLQPVKVGTRTVATKAGAIDKSLATRKARHTMGKVQKADIHGTPPNALAGSAVAPAPDRGPATPGPAASPAPVATPAPAATPTPTPAAPPG
jgi:hypothetical protein